jgi:hypothetical protein
LEFRKGPRCGANFRAVFWPVSIRQFLKHPNSRIDLTSAEFRILCLNFDIQTAPKGEDLVLYYPTFRITIYVKRGFQNYLSLDRNKLL